MTPLRRFLAVWYEMFAWEQEVYILLMRLTVHRRAILPALVVQAGGLLVVMWQTPGNVLLWSFVFILSFVYLLMARALVRR